MLGAELTAKGVRYCVWAPHCTRVEVEIEPLDAPRGEVRRLPAVSRGDGYHRVIDPQGHAGDRYGFRLDGEGPFPDPASRAQAIDVHGASVVIDPDGYHWKDEGWKRPPFRDLVIYELHIGTFTPAGTFVSAIEALPRLVELGINAIEIMPIADFPGTRNWGYDGVLIYAPARAYGCPDDLRRLVDAAHRLGVAVILDVVYNHLGPDGNYLGRFSEHYFNPAHHTPWGAAFNFDGHFSGEVRDFFASNPVYWMEQFHIDGVRLDATHAVVDESDPHIFTEITRAVHARGGYVIAEDSRNDARLLMAPEAGGNGFDGVWADDFHHVVRVAFTRETHSYFGNYQGNRDELVEVLQKGWFFHGQELPASGRRRGSEGGDLPPSGFIHCISNHDQTGNRAFGERLSDSVSPAAYRAASMLLCLSPYTPMLFMGQEWAASTPFLYFTDHNAELGPLVTEGRRREFAHFPGFNDEAALCTIPDPQAAGTFEKSKLRWEEIREEGHARVLALYRECLRWRREVRALRPAGRDGWEAGALPWGPVAIRFRGAERDWLLLIELWGGRSGVLGDDRFTHLTGGRSWQAMLSSNEARFRAGKEAAEPAFDPPSQRCRFEGAEVVLLGSSGAAG